MKKPIFYICFFSLLALLNVACSTKSGRSDDHASYYDYVDDDDDRQIVEEDDGYYDNSNTTSLDDARNALRLDIIVSNHDLPEEIDEGVEIQKFEYDEDNDVVVMTIVFDTQYTRDQIDMFTDIMKDQFVSSDDSSIQEMIELIKDAKADLRIVCKSLGGYKKTVLIPYNNL